MWFKIPLKPPLPLPSYSVFCVDQIHTVETKSRNNHVIIYQFLLVLSFFFGFFTPFIYIFSVLKFLFIRHFWYIFTLTTCLPPKNYIQNQKFICVFVSEKMKWKKFELKSYSNQKLYSKQEICIRNPSIVDETLKNLLEILKNWFETNGMFAEAGAHPFETHTVHRQQVH